MPVRSSPDQSAAYDFMDYVNYAGMATIMVLASLGMLSALSLLQRFLMPDHDPVDRMAAPAPLRTPAPPVVEPRVYRR